jgi:uncharacterized protein involved in tolerance to divalent cations
MFRRGEVSAYQGWRIRFKRVHSCVAWDTGSRRKEKVEGTHFGLTLRMEAACFFKTSVSTYRTIQSQCSENHNLKVPVMKM